jgi:predicted TIM-barrel fold metal-dependent hydrolase
MYKDTLIGDGVMHAYNNNRSNARSDTAEQVLEDIHGLSTAASAPGTEHPEERWFRNFTAEDIEEASFLESDVDFGVYHSTPIFDYFHDGYSALGSGVKMRDNNPDRVKLLGCVDPLSSDATEEMERQVNELDVDGFKMYPTFYRDGKVKKLEMDDDLLPLVEKAHELGIEHIGVHKVFPLGPVGQHHVDVGDVADVAGQYPDIKFELLHTDLAFLEEIKLMLNTHDNIYANLEFTTAFLYFSPKRFREILGELLMWGGPEKIIWSTGVPLVHPQSLIKAMWELEFTEEEREEYNYPELTDDIKKMILGENLANLYGWDTDKLRSTVQDDKWSQRRQEEGKPDPWSGIEIDAVSADD